ncbi:MAG: outer membrane protein assembly factor BamA [bacterium]|nr:outer membrane protein assembly factor BamA [bacterium]
MRRVRAWIALLTLLLVAGVFSPVVAQEGPRVVDVEVVGNRITAPSLILGVSKIDKGSPINATIIQETMRRLYGLGIFSDVKLEAEEVTGGLKLFIIVKELPKLSGLTFSGNDKFSSKELTEKLKLGVGGYISPFLVHEKAEQIRKLYADKGYFQATVGHTLTYSADSSEAVLVYQVNERSKVKVENVVMTGNKEVPAGDLIGKMRNRKRGFLKSSDYAEEKYEEDLTKIVEEYHKRGFIDAYVVSDSQTIDTSISRMTIYLEVYEGPRYYFGESIFKGNSILKTKTLERALKHIPGEVFDAEKYDKSLMEIYTTYQEIGHLHIRVNDERTTRSDSLLDITYDITEGLPSHINLVRIVGNNKTKDKVIRRELSTLPGQTFSRSLLIRSVRDAMALNYFANVEPTPIDLANGDVDIEYKVTEKQTGQVSAGAGYNSQDKLVGSVGLGIPNLMGNGQSVSFQVEKGNRRNSFSLSFTEPWLFGRPTLLSTDIYTTNRRWYEDYTEGRQGASIRVGRRLRWPDNYFRIYGAYRLESNRIYDFSDAFVFSNSIKDIYYQDREANDSLDLPPAGDTLSGDKYAGYVRRSYLPGSILEEDGNWRTASRFSFTLTRDSRNLPEFATSGSQFSYTFESTGGFLGGYYRYQHHQIEYAKFIPLFWGMAIAAKVEWGAVTSPFDDDHILLSDRFTPGGTSYDGIVRGYDDGVLTPDSTVYDQDRYFLIDSLLDTTDVTDQVRDSNTVRIRGNYMFVTNMELQIPIANQQLYGLIFFDAGNSWRELNDVKVNSLYRGVGFGFRIAVPGIGTIGFDFAYPLDKYRDESQKWKPHFQIGTTFK